MKWPKPRLASVNPDYVPLPDQTAEDRAADFAAIRIATPAEIQERARRLPRVRETSELLP
jgi:hypothetical protein